MRKITTSVKDPNILAIIGSMETQKINIHVLNIINITVMVVSAIPTVVVLRKPGIFENGMYVFLMVLGFLVFVLLASFLLAVACKHPILR